MPMAIAANIKTRSLESLTGFLNRIIDIAPTRANALAMFEPIIIIIRAIIIPTKTIEFINERE